jgi:hypothetical protein
VPSRNPRRPAEEAEAEIVLADYEDFDVEPYREVEPSRREISHDVPAVLMDGRAGEGTVRTVQGFRIQIASSIERYDAVLAEEQAKSWWREDGRSGTPACSARTCRRTSSTCSRITACA